MWINNSWAFIMSLFYFMVMLRGKDKCYDLIPLSIVCLFQSNCHRNTRNQTIARAGVGLKSFQSSWVSSRLITSRPQWCASTWQHMVLLDLLWTARITENAFCLCDSAGRHSEAEDNVHGSGTERPENTREHRKANVKGLLSLCLCSFCKSLL